jgi:hypothetical protein
MWHFKILNGHREAIYEWTFPTKEEALGFMNRVSVSTQMVGHKTGRWVLEQGE